MSDHPDWLSTRWLLAYLSPFAPSPVLPDSPAQWNGILAAADGGLVLPRLALRIMASPEDVPPHVTEYLSLCRELCALRDDQLRRQLSALIEGLNARGIVPVVMKGATALLDGTEGATGRVMLDLDICVPEALDHPGAFAVLDELGYATSGTLDTPSEHHHFPSYFRDDTLARIELHHRFTSNQRDIRWDEDGARSRLIARQYGILHYRIMGADDALRLSYLQCRAGCDVGHFNVMKWLDFLDRWQAKTPAPLNGLRDLGIASPGNALDRQLFTALGELGGLPYSGPADRALVNAWRRTFSQPAPLRAFKNIFRNALDPYRWQHMTAGDILRAAGRRLSGLRASLHRSRNGEFS